MSLPIIIVGAGAAGLMAGRELSAAGFPVIILEAAPQPGGRIHTLQAPGEFSTPVETGAEFVHGQLPVTLGLLNTAGITYRPVKGKMVRVSKGKWGGRDLFSGGDWDQLMEKMGELQQDLSIAAFLDTRFPGERYGSLRDSIRSFAEGYDLADIQRASTLALYKEWQEEGETEYRIDGGYGRLIQYLVEQCETHGGRIEYNAPVNNIQWEKDKVIVTTAAGPSFTGCKVIVTVSLGILQQEPETGHISFHPSIPTYLQAARSLGYGTVIKILMEFRRPFWEPRAADVGFILSDEAVPTWWLQAPDNNNLITGWLTGQAMRTFQILDPTAQLDACLSSLAAIFDLTPSFLKDELLAFRINDWSRAPYVQGGYSYETVGCSSARKLLMQPLDDTLFFAGETLFEGSALATVEAALTSGQEVAKKIIAQS